MHDSAVQLLFDRNYSTVIHMKHLDRLDNSLDTCSVCLSQAEVREIGSRRILIIA